MPMKHKKNDVLRGLVRDESIINLVEKYLVRTYKNLELMNIISQLSTNKEAQKALKLPEEYSNDEWMIITAYYAMYTSALALLAKIGYKSDNHTATILALEKFFVKKELIGQEYLAMFRPAQLSRQDVSDISKRKRE